MNFYEKKTPISPCNLVEALYIIPIAADLLKESAALCDENIG